QLPQPVNFGTCTAFHTLTLDLRASEDELLRGMDKGTRYEIRRAQTKDAVRWRTQRLDGKNDLHQFVDAYEMCLQPGNATRRLNVDKLGRFVRAGFLDVSVVEDLQGDVLTWHVHVLAGGIARLLYSVSPASRSPESDRRNLAGRANRFHHWMDIKNFKDRELNIMDFGGFYEGSDDLKKLEINKFKQCFGGKRVVTWNCLYPTSMLGRLALAVWGIRPKMRAAA
ncbi:MAG: hypothetical protein JSR16_04150, partial [Proteobacteria bacterium]|nr:hypothetical protein [Pseudomonadota bacterium]